MDRLIRLGLIAGVLLPLASTPSRAVPLYPDEIDHSAFDELLRSYVNAEGLVNYADFRAHDVQTLDAYLDRLARAELAGMSRAQRLAFWMNAYNARVLKQILSDPKLRQVSADKTFFDRSFPVAGASYSLNDIEHRILRGKPNPTTQEGAIRGVTLEVFDPRIHFALCDGSLGSAPLKNFAYTAAMMETALTANALDFANSPKALRAAKGRLIISDLMNRYAEDFQMGGGPAAYLSQRLSPDRRPDAAELKRLLITQYRRADFVYDWTLNDVLHSPR